MRNLAKGEAMRLRLVKGEPEQLVVDAVGDDGWKVTARLEIGARKTVVVRSVEVSPPDGEEVDVVGSAVWRRLGIVDFQRNLRMLYPIGAPLRPGWPVDMAPGPRPGGAGRPVQFYAYWVGRYIDALARDGRRPIKVMVEEARADPRSAQDAQLVASDVRRYLDKAEKLGLLTDRPAMREGKAGGKMTAKCRKLLRTPQTPSRTTPVDQEEIRAVLRAAGVIPQDADDAPVPRRRRREATGVAAAGVIPQDEED